MFRAVRSWWQSGRGRDTSRLFLFELTVVMIGVLAAQQVSNWANNRAALKQVEGVHSDIIHLYTQYRVIAKTYDVAIPCYERRRQLLMHAAADISPVDPQLLVYAPIVGIGPDEISASDYQLLLSRYGHQTRDLIGSVQFILAEARDNGRSVAAEWFEFQRLDPRYGAVSSEDRSAARAAAVRISGYLAGLQKSADLIQKLTGEMRIPDKADAKLRPVASCDEMWRTGQGYVDRG